MGNSCCFKKPLPVQKPEQLVIEKPENKPFDQITSTTHEVQVKSKLDREQPTLKQESEEDNHLRVSELRRAAMILPRQVNEQVEKSTALRQSRLAGKECSSKDSSQTKFKAGELGTYRSGSTIYESAKYKILECLDSDTGKLFSLKTIQVLAGDQLDEADMSLKSNMDHCIGLANFVQKRVYQIQHENLIQYFYADFNQANGSSFD